MYKQVQDALNFFRNNAKRKCMTLLLTFQVFLIFDVTLHVVPTQLMQNTFYCT